MSIDKQDVNTITREIQKITYREIRNLNKLTFLVTMQKRRKPI